MNSATKRKPNILTGITLTFLVYSTSLLIGKNIAIASFLPQTFYAGTGLMIGALCLIYFFSKKGALVLPLEKVKWGIVWEPVLTVIIVFVLVNIITIGILSLLNIEAVNEGHIVVKSLSALQLLIFAVFYASLTEELLFRGFLQNYLQEYANRGITIFGKVRISMPVIVSGLAFGLAHLVLLRSGSAPFVLRVVIFTFCVGVTAGYYQERYRNFWLAVLVHSLFNLLAFLSKMV